MATRIHGLRIYPQSVDVARGVDATILIHGSIREDCSDLFYTFRVLAPVFRGHLFAEDFVVSYDQDGHKLDPLPWLRETYGSSLVVADVDSQIMLLKGDDFEQWGGRAHFNEGAFFPIFKERPSFAILKQIFWGHPRLASESWPAHLRAILHLRDGIYWQFFTTDRADLDILLRAHAGDAKLDMYIVDFDREYPDPSGQELQPAKIPTEHDGCPRS